MWRTGSTYVWSKFREQKKYRAYYEPLHETFIQTGLGARASGLQAVHVLGASWSGEVTLKMRHPCLDAFYFAEYEPLLEAKGTHFEKGFPYQRYCLEDGDSNEPLRHYVADLLIFAMAHGQTPALKFNRALLRSGWLAAQFQPVNILVLRRPIDVWKSFVSFENLYFPTVLCLIAGQNQRHRLLESMMRRSSVPFYEGETFEAEYDFYHDFATRNLGNLYPLFYEFYLRTAVYAARYAHCILDLDEISVNASARARLTQVLESLGIHISLADCRVPSCTSLSSHDRDCLASEAHLLKLLKQDRLAAFRIPKDTFTLHRDALSRYFDGALSLFLTEEEQELRAPTGRLTATEKHTKGIRLFEQGRFEEASRLFRDALLDGQTAEGWNDWGTAQAACNRPALAELGYRRALHLDDGRAATNLGILLANLKRYGEAIPLLERGLKGLEGGEGKALRDLVKLCQSRYQVQEAFQALA
jgi:tetratricopeptide (TPR) repeat protein